MIAWVLIAFLILIVVITVVISNSNAGNPTDIPTVTNISRPRPVSIEVTPNAAHLPSTIKLQYTAIATFRDGSQVDITNLSRWSVDNLAIASISTHGNVTGLAAGTTQVIASYLGVVGETTLTVTDAILVAITISPLHPAVAIGATLQLAAIGTFSDGSSVDITHQCTWHSNNTNVITVTSTGLITGVAGGSCQISATLDSVSGVVVAFCGS